MLCHRYVGSMLLPTVLHSKAVTCVMVSKRHQLSKKRERERERERWQEMMSHIIIFAFLAECCDILSEIICLVRPSLNRNNALPYCRTSTLPGVYSLHLLCSNPPLYLRDVVRQGRARQQLLTHLSPHNTCFLVSNLGS